MSSEPRLLILETSSAAGFVALASGERLLGVRQLDEQRRHARDLVPAVRDLLAECGWPPRELHGVIVSRGPGSYTGLRVGIMSAKTLAYATGCKLLAIDTFAAIARQAPAEAFLLFVVADAQQDKVYVQRFKRLGAGDPMVADSPLAIHETSDWLPWLDKATWVTGPGLQKHRSRLAEDVPVVDASSWNPQPESLLQIGLARYERGEFDDFWTLEPLYLRPSAAEEKWRDRTIQAR